jgi:hypothetical protein
MRPHSTRFVWRGLRGGFEARFGVLPFVVDILPFLKEGNSYRRGLRRFLGGFLLLTAYIAIHFTG